MRSLIGAMLSGLFGRSDLGVPPTPVLMPLFAPAMVRSNRPHRREPNDGWLKLWAADHVGRGFDFPIFEPLPSGYLWKQDIDGPRWRIYRVPA